MVKIRMCSFHVGTLDGKTAHLFYKDKIYFVNKETAEELVEKQKVAKYILKKKMMDRPENKMMVYNEENK